MECEWHWSGTCDRAVVKTIAWSVRLLRNYGHRALGLDCKRATIAVPFLGDLIERSEKLQKRYLPSLTSDPIGSRHTTDEGGFGGQLLGLAARHTVPTFALQKTKGANLAHALDLTILPLI